MTLDAPIPRCISPHACPKKRSTLAFRSHAVGGFIHPGAASHHRYACLPLRTANGRNLRMSAMTSVSEISNSKFQIVYLASCLSSAFSSFRASAIFLSWVAARPHSPSVIPPFLLLQPPTQVRKCRKEAKQCVRARDKLRPFNPRRHVATTRLATEIHPNPHSAYLPPPVLPLHQPRRPRPPQPRAPRRGYGRDA